MNRFEKNPTKKNTCIAMAGFIKLLPLYFGIALTSPVIIWADTVQSHTITANVDVTTNTIHIDQTIDWTNNSETIVDHIYLKIDNTQTEKNPYISDVLNDVGYVKSFDGQQHTIMDVYHNETSLVFEMIDDEDLSKIQMFSTGQNLVKIILDTPIKPREAIQLHINSKKRIANSYVLKESYAFRDTVGLRFGWYPVIVNDQLSHNDYFKLPRHNVNQLVLGVNEAMTIGLSASQITINRTVESTTVTAMWDYPIHGIGVSMSPHTRKVFGKTANDTIIDLIAPDHIPVDDSETVIGYIKNAYDYYTEHYGPLPYKRIVVSSDPNQGYYGRAINGHVFLGSSVFYTYYRSAGAIFSRLNQFLIAHEIAHLWSGFDMNFNHENALSEGLTQYMALTFLNHHFGPSYVLVDQQYESLFNFDLNFQDPVFEFLKNSQYVSQLAVKDMLNMNWDEPLHYPFDQSNLSIKQTKDYHKSAIVFSMLEATIGRSAMNQALASYTNYANKDRSFESLKTMTQATTTKNMTAFFDAWVFNKAHIDFSVTDYTSVTSDNGYSSVIEIHKSGTAPTALPVRVNYTNNTSSDHVLESPTQHTALAIQHDQPIESISLDPNMMLFETDRFNNTFPKKSTTITFMDWFNNKKKTTLMRDHRVTDATALYLFTPYVVAMPSLFSSPYGLGLQVRKQQYLDYNWQVGFGFESKGAYRLGLYQGYQKYMKKNRVFSALVQYFPFETTQPVETVFGMIHPYYTQLKMGYYGQVFYPLSRFSYGIKTAFSLNNSKNVSRANFFTKYSYSNFVTYPSMVDIEYDFSSFLHSPSFAQLTVSAQTFHRVVAQRVVSPKIQIGTGRNAPLFSAKAIRGISSETDESQHILIGSLDYLFPIKRYNHDDAIRTGINGIQGGLFYEVGVLPDSDLLKLDSPYQTIGIEFGISGPKSLGFVVSVGYAYAIETPDDRHDEEVYFNIGGTNLMSIFKSLYFN
jgi:hypothetical protein